MNYRCKSREKKYNGQIKWQKTFLYARFSLNFAAKSSLSGKKSVRFAATLKLFC
jgi:hypothetical protein